MSATEKFPVSLDDFEGMAVELDATAATVLADLERLPAMVTMFGEAASRCRALSVGLGFPLERGAEDIVEGWGGCDKPDVDLRDTRDLVALARFAIGRTRERAEAEGGADDAE